MPFDELTHGVYQISVTNYSGASGCPIIHKKTNSLAGILYGNISFDTEKGKIEVGSCCFCISKDIICEIYDAIDICSENNLVSKLKENKFLNRKYHHEIDKLMNHYKF